MARLSPEYYVRAEQTAASWVDFVIALEHAHVRVEGVGAVELDDLPGVPQVVKGKLVEQLVESQDTEFFVPSGATARGHGQGVEPGQRVTPSLLEGGEFRASIEFLARTK